MATANDGMKFGGGMGARQHNATLDAKPAPPAADPAQPKSISDDPAELPGTCSVPGGRISRAFRFFCVL